MKLSDNTYFNCGLHFNSKIIMNKYLLQLLLSVLLGIYLGVELLGNMVILFLFLRNHQNVFHRGYTILHFYQQCMSVPVFHILVNACYFSFFLKIIIAILVGVKWYLIVGFFFFFSFYFFGHPAAYGVPGPGIRSKLQLPQCQILNQLRWAGE